MDETVDKVAERLARLARLEVTVAQGFHETKSRFHEAELRDHALSRKIDVNTESLRADFQTLVEIVTANTDEARRTTIALRAEHAADRDILRLALEQHSRRLNDLEHESRRP